MYFSLHEQLSLQNKAKTFQLFSWLFRYKSTMRLNITRIRPQDYGEYHCISKNEMGFARAVFHLQGNDFLTFSSSSETLFYFASRLCFTLGVTMSRSSLLIFRCLFYGRTKSLHHARPSRLISQPDCLRCSTTRERIIRRHLWTAPNMSRVPRTEVNCKFRLESLWGLMMGLMLFYPLHRNPINFNCRDFKCKDTVVSLYDLVGGSLEVKLTGNRTYMGLPNRTLGEIPVRLNPWRTRTFS